MQTLLLGLQSPLLHSVLSTQRPRFKNNRSSLMRLGPRSRFIFGAIQFPPLGFDGLIPFWSVGGNFFGHLHSGSTKRSTLNPRDGVSILSPARLSADFPLRMSHPLPLGRPSTGWDCCGCGHPLWPFLGALFFCFLLRDKSYSNFWHVETKASFKPPTSPCH